MREATLGEHRSGQCAAAGVHAAMAYARELGLEVEEVIVLFTFAKDAPVEERHAIVGFPHDVANICASLYGSFATLMKAQFKMNVKINLPGEVRRRVLARDGAPAARPSTTRGQGKRRRSR